MLEAESCRPPKKRPRPVITSSDDSSSKEDGGMKSASAKKSETKRTNTTKQNDRVKKQKVKKTIDDLYIEAMTKKSVDMVPAPAINAGNGSKRGVTKTIFIFETSSDDDEQVNKQVRDSEEIKTINRSLNNNERSLATATFTGRDDHDISLTDEPPSIRNSQVNIYDYYSSFLFPEISDYISICARSKQSFCYN